MSAKTPPITHVHGESMRIGIQLAGLVWTSSIPPLDVVQRIAATRPAHILVTDFPLETLTVAHRERQERRRLYAMRAMEVMLHHAGESSLLTRSGIEDLVARAWTVASAMESQENVASQLDTIADPKAT